VSIFLYRCKAVARLAIPSRLVQSLHRVEADCDSFLPGAQHLWEKSGWTLTVQDLDGVWDTLHMINLFKQ
jgi:hypothetical protein